MGWHYKKNRRSNVTQEEKVIRSWSSKIAKWKQKAKKRGEDYHTPVTLINVLDSVEKMKNEFPNLRNAEKKNRNRQSRKRVQRAS